MLSTCSYSMRSKQNFSKVNIYELHKDILMNLEVKRIIQLWFHTSMIYVFFPTFSLYFSASFSTSLIFISYLVVIVPINAAHRYGAYNGLDGLAYYLSIREILITSFTSAQERDFQLRASPEFF